jgi:HNH endonuclease
MNSALEQEVRDRAETRCEYCRAFEEDSDLAFSFDHIIARQHLGETVSENLAYACGDCNRHKGPNIAGVDPETRVITRLFHPRRDVWADHFRWNGPILTGLTPIGRATILVLGINLAAAVALRRTLIERGRFPNR